MLTIKRAQGDAVTQLDRASAPELLRDPSAPVWLDIDAPTAEELKFLETELRIHHLTIEDIVKQNQRPKLESFEHYVYMAIHPLARNDRLEVEPKEVDLLLGRHWVVTVHYGPVPGWTDDSQATERLDRALAKGPDFLLYTAVDLIVDSYFPLMDRIEDEIESLEGALLGQQRLEDMNRLLALKRSLILIRRATGPQREVFNQLTRHDFPFVRPEHGVYFRDVYDHLIRITEELDSLRDILSGTLEIHLAAISNQLNVTIKRLSAWGTILVAITAITGIYGMNFEFMPELRWRYGYPAILAVMAALSAALYFYFKRKDYL
ncbi:MAG TPA: magnesium/cobalt transporter CorA [Candidatus Acidoferrales bacterium]|nr:magnesium/cobalt transporter CorA [Candidatus Acidoferrales bacterium]